MLIFIVALIIVLLVLVGGALFFFDFAICRNPHIRMSDNNSAASDTMKGWEDRVEEGEKYFATLPKEEWRCISRDGLVLAADFFPAQQPTENTVVCVHGYRSSGEREFGPFIRFYHERGWNLLLVDNRGHGQSEGNYIGFGWLDKDDVLCWLNELHVRHPQSRVLLHGISMGSAAVLMASGEPDFPDCVCGIVADCGYSSVWEQMRVQLRAMFHLPAFPLLHLMNLVCRLRAGYSFHEADTVAQVRTCHTPVLFIHGGADTFVPTFMVYTLYDACPAEKELFLVPSAGHAQSYMWDKAGYEARVLGFAEHVGFGKTVAMAHG